MGCCFSQTDKTTVYEVTLDANGVARRVPVGTGTHFIHITSDYETHLEEKQYTVQPPTPNDTDINRPPQAHQSTRFPFLPARMMPSTPKPNSKISPIAPDDEKTSNNPTTTTSL
ncbi:hypothetical protein BDB00DRAFT_873367 [Zychaea mexicana]|uniref:uncharacterized protein n=1 Tax=Zychaea mexicana TaxID=64656 RepID=UPI0022FEF547|nr:uncharacterized protein BDB00DRAFT_873367 [Zychaea mexicana]KAI9492455.1 hypothetical protein BDB00DRAFT_873367 [Zychaea mexicana]